MSAVFATTILYVLAFHAYVGTLAVLTQGFGWSLHWAGATAPLVFVTTLALPRLMVDRQAALSTLMGHLSIAGTISAVVFSLRWSIDGRADSATVVAGVVIAVFSTDRPYGWMRVVMERMTSETRSFRPPRNGHSSSR